MFPEEQNNLFQTVSQIGIGKFGRCFLCKRRTNGKLVVIKKVPQSAEAKNEARLLSLVTGHEHVVTFYESYLSYRSTYIVLEYMAGGNLDDYIQCQGEKPFKEKTVLNFTAQLASALAHIHGRRVVHRDVKPRNVLLSADHKQLKLCDLGIAVQLAEGQRLWGHIGQAGTDCYMAPELLEAQGYDFKADVWSLGCIVYELVERKRAFTGQQLAVWHKICKGRYVLSQESKFNELIASLLVPSQYNRPAAKDIPAMLDLLRARIANSGTGCVRLNFWPIRRTTTNAGADEKKKATAGEGANAGPSSTSKAATSQ